jgi:23S rRNA (uracil1939-C5)-methyltransferase
MGESLIVTVSGIAAGGAGVGRLPDGRVTFIHRTAPGDRVSVRLVEEKPRWTRGRVLRVLDEGPGRREAPCPHYARCGGCTLEHMTYPAQLEAKARIVADALGRIAGIPMPPPPIEASPAEFRYRNRVSFTLRREGGSVTAGFHEIDRADRLVDIGGACLLPEDAVATAWSALRAEWGPAAHRLPSGSELRLTLRGTVDGAVSLGIEGGYAPGRPEELVAAIPSLRAVWHRPAGADELALLAGDDILHEVWNGEGVALRGDVFMQVNRSAAAALEAHVMDRVLALHPGRVLDAYCGVGLYSRRLERAGVEVVGIEAHPAAVAEARRGAAGSRILEGLVEAVVAGALPVDVAIVNPPRAGVDAAVVAALADNPPRAIVYVSCNPATLARDLKRLGPGWRVTDARCFDLFPQTAHVETVVELQCDTM